MAMQTKRRSECLNSDERLDEVAGILARAVLRLAELSRKADLGERVGLGFSVESSVHADVLNRQDIQP